MAILPRSSRPSRRALMMTHRPGKPNGGACRIGRKGKPSTSVRDIGMQKPLAEFIGTFTLVLFGCGAAVIGGMGTGPTSIDVLGIAFAFGLAIVAMAYGIG